jgi:hypothetical protein
MIEYIEMEGLKLAARSSEPVTAKGNGRATQQRHKRHTADNRIPNPMCKLRGKTLDESLQTHAATGTHWTAEAAEADHY